MPARKLVLHRARPRARALAAILVAAATFSTPAAGQLISIRTVPLAQGDQFEIFPSNNGGMGGVGVALNDTLRDPFANPSKGARLRGARAFGSPSFFSMSHDAGGGRTLPLGAMLRGKQWFGGMLVAAQEVDPSREPDPGPGVLTPFSSSSFAPAPQQDQVVDPALQRTGLNSGGNKYAFGTLGREFSRSETSRTSLAASVFLADLKSVDGVDLLYANSRSIAQSGGALDLRLGLLKEWAGAHGDHALDAVVLHNRYDMTHDVTYADFFWDPTARQTTARARIEQNLDRTNTWGAQLAYALPLARAGWRLGGVATTNLASHPKIPNYEIVNIPRDPGRSHAYNLGLGVSKRDSAAVFGADVVFEPIRSHTWADAAGPVPTLNGGTIPQGGRTIENRFRFRNAALRLGASQDIVMNSRDDGMNLQMGLAVRSVHYWLDQFDHVQGRGRTAEERWVEWTPTWGLTFRFPSLDLHYRGRLTTGTGRPGVAGRGGCCFAAELASSAPVGGNILAAPSGPLTLDPVRVLTNQIAISLPLR